MFRESQKNSSLALRNWQLSVFSTAHNIIIITVYYINIMTVHNEYIMVAVNGS